MKGKNPEHCLPVNTNVIPKVFVHFSTAKCFEKVGRDINQNHIFCPFDHFKSQDSRSPLFNSRMIKGIHVKLPKNMLGSTFFFQYDIYWCYVWPKNSHVYDFFQNSTVFTDMFKFCLNFQSWFLFRVSQLGTKRKIVAIGKSDPLSLIFSKIRTIQYWRSY